MMSKYKLLETLNIDAEMCVRIDSRPALLENRLLSLQMHVHVILDMCMLSGNDAPVKQWAVAVVRVVKDFRGIGAKFQKLHLKLPEVGVGGRQDAADFRALNSNMCGHTKSNDVSNEAGEAGSTERRSLESATRRASGGAAQKPRSRAPT